MIIAIGSDHGGVELKSALIQCAQQLGHILTDCGTSGSESVDYADYAQIVARKVIAGEADRGILICKTGIGMSISANKVKGIRAALVYNEEVATLSRKHNDANVICFGASFVDIDSVKEWLKIWLKTDFDGGRHQIRVDKIEKV